MSKTTWISALNPKIPYARFLKGSKSNRRKKHTCIKVSKEATRMKQNKNEDSK